jgi:glyoxylase-like metal-dependent hydrolase (beta-lactamase superfamily II)
LARAQRVNATFDVLADVSEILTSASIPLASINSIIWSHHHFEHAGDPSLFPPTTSLVVGPGFKSNPSTYPGFPINPDGYLPHSAFEGRDLIELDFSSSSSALKIGGLRAIDWFNDGSLYLLEAPGHAPEHIMALARTSANKFVLLTGDAAEHPGVIRPSALCPLPEDILLPASLLERAHSSTTFRTTPFYEPTPYAMPDSAAGRKTLEALQAFDASTHVRVVLAHDTSFREPHAHFPVASFARWEEEEARGEGKDAGAEHWGFLRDLESVGEQCSPSVQ